MSQAKKLYHGHVSQPIAKGQGCGEKDSYLFFITPIDLLAGDELFIDPASGQPLAIYRERRKIWEFEGVYVTASATINFASNPDLLSMLIGQAT